jgi:hypothetical protein
LAVRALHLLATSALPANASVIGATVIQTGTRITLQNLILADIVYLLARMPIVPLIAIIANIAKLLGGQSSMSIRPKRAYADRVDFLYLLLWAAVALAGLCILAPLLRNGWDA